MNKDLPLDGEVLVLTGGGDSHGLTEIPQTKTVRFAMLEKTDSVGTFKRFHPLVKCRDYLSDILHRKVEGGDVAIYGLNVPFKNNKLDVETTRFLIDFPSVVEVEKFAHNFPFIITFGEEYLEVAPPRLFAVDNQPTQLVFEGDSFWQRSTQLLSLTTLLCRAALYLDNPFEDWLNIPSKANGVDAAYIVEMKHPHHRLVDKLKNFKNLQFSKTTPSGWDKDIHIDTLHGASGIYTFILGPKYCSSMKDNAYVKQMDELLA